GFTCASFITSANGTPSQRTSKRLQRVTQCMSAVTAFIGRRANSSHVSRTGRSTSPVMRKSHVLGSKRGTGPSCSTGHFSVADWPGGRRPASRMARSSCLRSVLSPKIIFAPQSFRSGGLKSRRDAGATKTLFHFDLDSADEACGNIVNHRAEAASNRSDHREQNRENHNGGDAEKGRQKWRHARRRVAGGNAHE